MMTMSTTRSQYERLSPQFNEPGEGTPGIAYRETGLPPRRRWATLTPTWPIVASGTSLSRPIRAARLPIKGEHGMVTKTPITGQITTPLELAAFVLGPEIFCSVLWLVAKDL